MYATEHIDKFKHAVTEELLAANASLARHKVLFAKMTAFQSGKESAPTEEEFNQWVADVHLTVKLKRVLSGVAIN